MWEKSQFKYIGLNRYDISNIIILFSDDKNSFEIFKKLNILKYEVYKINNLIRKLIKFFTNSTITHLSNLNIVVIDETLISKRKK